MARLKFRIIGIFLQILLCPLLNAQDKHVQTVPLGNERLVIVAVQGSVGRVHLKKSSSDALFSVSGQPEKGEQEMRKANIRYTVVNGVGYLNVNLDEEDGKNIDALASLFSRRSKQSWTLHFSDRVPLSLSVSLGAGQADVDVTDLKIRELMIDAGAGVVRVRMDRPNIEEADRVSISSGMGSLESRKLGNLRFRNLDFEGGMGSYTLDCTGDILDGATISTDLGLGSLMVVLPADVGARARTGQNWFSSTELLRFVKEMEGVYVTPGYVKARKRVTLDLESGLGTVAVRWGK